MMKRKLVKLFVVLSSAIVLVLLLFFTNGIGELWHMLAHMKLYWIAAAFGCMVVYWFFDALLLHVTAEALLEKPPFRDSIKFTMIGQFFNAITPLSGAGQPVQAYVMVKDGIKPGHAASILIIKSLLHQLIIVVYSLVAFAFFGGLFGARISHFYYFFVLGLAFNTMFLLFYGLFIFNKQAARKLLMAVFKILSKLKFIKKLEALEKRVECELESFTEGARIFKTNIHMFIILVILQTVQFTFLFAIPYFIHLAVESQRAQLWEMVAAQSMITLISLLVPLPGSTGGVEGLSLLFYGLFFKAGYIIPVILIFRIITYYASVVFGGLFALLAPEKPLKQEST